MVCVKLKPIKHHMAPDKNSWVGFRNPYLGFRQYIGKNTSIKEALILIIGAILPTDTHLEHLLLFIFPILYE